MAGLKRSLGPPVELPAPCDDVTYMALKSLQTGTASGSQQQIAIKWIINDCCRTYDQPFRPGAGGDRDTAFACGRMFVGQQIVKQLNTNRVTKERPA